MMRSFKYLFCLCLFLLAGCESEIIPLSKAACPTDAYCVVVDRGNGTVYENQTMNATLTNGTYYVVVTK